MRNLKILTLCFSLASITFLSSAQLKEVDFIKGGIGDAQILFEEYLTPYANAFGADLNAGWYNTAKPHKLGGFDVTVTLNTAWAPDAARLVDLTELGLDATIIGPSPMAPTVAGKRMNDRPELAYYADYPGNPLDPIEIARYEVPNGTGVNIIPLPMAQIGIGLPWGTDVTVRFLPELDLGNSGKIGLWGVGFKHSILQHIPLAKRIPILEASIQGGYTDLNTHADVNFQPVGYDILDVPNFFFDDQNITLGVKAWTANFVVSQTLPIITFYQAIGYSNSTTSLILAGNYPVNRLETSGANIGKVIVDYDPNNLDGDGVVENPIDIEIQNSKDLRLNAGFRIKLGVLTFHFDYTKANYSVFTSGIGISFR